MLQGTSRAPDEIIATVPPDLTPCTVEKVAINAVMAGCRPEYLPVVLGQYKPCVADIQHARFARYNNAPRASVRRKRANRRPDRNELGK